MSKDLAESFDDDRTTLEQAFVMAEHLESFREAAKPLLNAILEHVDLPTLMFQGDDGRFMTADDSQDSELLYIVEPIRALQKEACMMAYALGWIIGSTKIGIKPEHIAEGAEEAITGSALASAEDYLQFGVIEALKHQTTAGLALNLKRMN